MKRDTALYIKDILQNMRDAREFIRGMTMEEFATDKKTFNAVVRSIEVIGEADPAAISQVGKNLILARPANAVNRRTHRG